MSRPLVSVIIPTHNRRAFLRQALDSVAEQTLKDYEVIVVDDGSTEAVADHIVDHATKPTVIRQSKQGPAAARNRGIERASADIVAFLDSDDLWRPAKLERFIDALESRPDTRIFYGPMYPITADGRDVPGRTKPCHAGWITEHLFCSSFVHVPTVVCRKELLTSACGFDRTLPVCEDYDLWLRISLKEPFGLVEEPLALRRLHKDRLSKTRMSRNLAVKAYVLQKFYAAESTNGHLSRDVATARLARVCYVAGRAAFRNRHYRQAIELCRMSRQYGGSALRNVPLVWVADTLARFARNGRSTNHECTPGGDSEQPDFLRRCFADEGTVVEGCPESDGRSGSHVPEQAKLLGHDA